MSDSRKAEYRCIPTEGGKQKATSVNSAAANQHTCQQNSIALRFIP